jgi:hypothetical protein
MTARDPRIDPQPGDELRAGFTLRRVIERDGERLLVEKWGQRVLRLVSFCFLKDCGLQSRLAVDRYNM